MLPVRFYVKQLLMALTVLGTSVFFFFVILTQHFFTETLILVALEISTDSFLPRSTVISSIEDTNFILTRKYFFLILKIVKGEWQGLPDVYREPSLLKHSRLHLQPPRSLDVQQKLSSSGECEKWDVSDPEWELHSAACLLPFIPTSRNADVDDIQQLP